MQNITDLSTEQNLRKNAKGTMIAELIIGLYLTTCLFLMDDGDDSCTLNPYLRLKRFLLTVVAPCFVARFMTCVCVRGHSKLEMGLFLIACYWYFSFGLWAAINIDRVMNMSEADEKFCGR